MSEVTKLISFQFELQSCKLFHFKKWKWYVSEKVALEVSSIHIAYFYAVFHVVESKGSGYSCYENSEVTDTGIEHVFC